MRVDYVTKGENFSVKLLDKLTFADHMVFRKLLEDIKTANAKFCTLDMSGLEMIDSSGLGMLMIALDESKKHGFKLSISSPSGAVAQLLKLSRMDQLLNAA